MQSSPLVATFLVFAFCAANYSVKAGSSLQQKRSATEPKTTTTCRDLFVQALADCSSAHHIKPNEPDPPPGAADAQSCCTMVNCLAGKAPGNTHTCKDDYATTLEYLRSNYTSPNRAVKPTGAPASAPVAPFH
ncbi:hypothetical protein TYRP_023099 [Tyrophagus putrescentiae]|nr:hypothetical protein TYRP_023099 [Tyrophagus putrescentiae]